MPRKKENIKEQVVEEAPVKTRAPLIKDYELIKYVIATEKTQNLQSKNNSFVFAVEKSATKLEIKRAITALFGAKIKSVRTINVRPKDKRVGRYSGHTSSYKKAIVCFDSSFDLGKIASTIAPEDMKPNEEK